MLLSRLISIALIISLWFNVCLAYGIDSNFNNTSNDKYNYLLKPLIGKKVEVTFDDRIIKGYLIEVGIDYIRVKSNDEVFKISIRSISKLIAIKKINHGVKVAKLMKGVFWGSIIFVGALGLVLVIGAAREQ